MANVHHLLQDEQPSTAATATIKAGPVDMAVNHNNITPLSNAWKYSEDLPCEKYRQFMDSSIQERTFMIEKLVETFANVIDSIWHPKFLVEHQQVKVMPTRGFCNEILKRSKATYSTLQISLFYIFRVKKVVHEKLYQRISKEKNGNMQTNTQMDDLMCCGRRMFLASLMVASKYLHDKNYHNKAWAKITGLDIKEINAAEMAFLNLIDYRLYVSKPTFDRWYTQIHGHIQKSYNKSAPIPTNKPFVVSKDNANISMATSGIPCNHPNTTININITNYPSPPPDENTNHPLAPLSPPPTTTTTTTNNNTITAANSSSDSSSSCSSTDNKCNTYQRTDSGISFDIFSPPTTIGAKRQWETNESAINNNKRICQ